MPWFKVDDNLAFHHKVVAAGNPALGLWVRAGSLCAQQLTDGFVPDHMIPALGTIAQAKKLVQVGLWDRARGGYRFHGWDERQPSKASVEAERAAAQERMRAYRAKKKGTSPTASPQVDDVRADDVQPNERGTNGEVRKMFGNPDPTHPDPTHPDPPKTAGAKRAHQLPEDFEPNATNRRIAEERGLDLRSVFEQFADHHRAKGTTMKDWHLAFNTWLRREKPGQAKTAQVHHLHVRDIEQPPDGLTDQEYYDWYVKQHGGGA